MPSLTFDGRSFMLDGRRLWIVSGTLHFARTPREQWADAIHAAKLAGLNTLEIPIIWANHEPRPGTFDFTGEHDLKHLLGLIHAQGMHAILRPGPFVGEGYDFGGMPGWLRSIPDIAYRTASAPFLEAVSRYVTALSKQIKDLQVTSTRVGGPVLMVHVESGWACGSDEPATKYLGEIDRYYREAGINVPLANTNNLWTNLEAEIDGWSGDDQLIAMTRQLGTVRPLRPRMVLDMRIGTPSVFGKPDAPRHTPEGVQRRIAEVLAAGGQFNANPFYAGLSLGFSSGRLAGDAADFVAHEPDAGSILAADGSPGPSFNLARRICTFASHFHRVFSHVEPDFQPALLDPGAPNESPKAAKALPVSIAHVQGSQGSVVFLFTPDDASAKGRTVHVLLPDGTNLPVALGTQPVSWVLMNAHLSGRSRLDYSTLNALAVVGKTLVVFGAAGVDGLVSINGSPIELRVPGGKSPTITEHEGITIVVASEDQVDTIFVDETGVTIGAAGISQPGESGSAIAKPAPGIRKVIRIDAQGVEHKAETPPAPRGAPKTTCGEWTAASTDDHIQGTSPRFATIDGPGDLISLGANAGYGWYRIAMKQTAAKKVKAIAPEASDRLHAFIDGEPLASLGDGPGTEGREVTLPLTKGANTIVVLAENMGRLAEGDAMGEPKGLFGHLWDGTPFKTPKPKLVQGEPLEPLKHTVPIMGVSDGDVTHHNRLTWSFTHRKKAPLIVTIPPVPVRMMLVLNDAPQRLLEANLEHRIMLDQDTLNRGANELALAFITDARPATDEADAQVAEVAKAITSGASIIEGTTCVTEKAEWAFARWEQPADTAFAPVAKSQLSSRKAPTWWRTTFAAADSDRPLRIDLAGMTKGQVYLNGKHVGRYFAATATGAKVGPRQDMLLPAAWIAKGVENDLVIFDEHGGNPGKIKLVHEKHEPFRA